MIRAKRRTFSLLLGGAVLVGACGGRVEETVGTGTLDASGGTGVAVGGGAMGGGAVGDDAMSATNGDGAAGGAASSGSDGMAATSGAPAQAGAGLAMPGGAFASGGAGAATATAGAPAGGAPARMPASGTSAAGTGGAPSAVDCNDLHNELEIVYNEARACDSNAAEDECTAGVVPPFGCQTPFYFNPANADAIALFTSVAQATVDGRCPVAGASTCVPVIRGRCNPSTNQCDGVPQGIGRNCEVNGRVYASGESGIYNPWSCSTCSCNDGLLDCPAMTGACDAPTCPAGQMLGNGCSECAKYGVGTSSGPVTLCQTVEYGCFTPCSAGCTDPNSACEDNLCVPAACPVMDPSP
jgi:hypothetical protein